MRQFRQNSTPEDCVDRLTSLAETQDLDIAPEELAALAKQLRALEALEIDELHEYPPILKMDPRWHD